MKIATAAAVESMQRISAAIRSACAILGCGPDDLPRTIEMRRIEAEALKGKHLSLCDIEPLLSRKRAKFLRANPAKALQRIERDLAAVRPIIQGVT